MNLDNFMEVITGKKGACWRIEGQGFRCRLGGKHFATPDGGVTKLKRAEGILETNLL